MVAPPRTLTARRLFGLGTSELLVATWVHWEMRVFQNKSWMKRMKCMKCTKCVKFQMMYDVSCRIERIEKSDFPSSGPVCLLVLLWSVPFQTCLFSAHLQQLVLLRFWAQQFSSSGQRLWKVWPKKLARRSGTASCATQFQALITFLFLTELILVAPVRVGIEAAFHLSLCLYAV